MSSNLGGAMKKVPIYILTGFLGSGKTTLLKRFIQEEQRKNKKIGVIMNVFNLIITLPCSVNLMQTSQ